MAEILVVGSLHYDIVLNAPNLPARDETVMGRDVQFICGGKGGNQAVAAGRHGASVAFAGALGDDFFADALLANLHEAGVDTDGIKRLASTASGMSVAIVEAGGEYGAVVASGANQHIDSEAVDIPDGTRLVILQNEIAEDVNVAVSRRARERGARVVLNAAPMRRLPDELLQLTDVLIVNRFEAEKLLARPITNRRDALGAVRGSSIPCSVFVVTLGEEGLVYRAGAAEPRHLEAFAVSTISSHGAGDAFVGALSARLAGDDGLDQALRYASAAAALHVSTPVAGRGKIGPAEVARLLSGRPAEL